jgi:hypothetical protein
MRQKDDETTSTMVSGCRLVPVTILRYFARRSVLDRQDSGDVWSISFGRDGRVHRGNAACRSRVALSGMTASTAGLLRHGD